MPSIISISEAVPEFIMKQTDIARFVKGLFSNSFNDIDRLLNVFENGQIENRYFAKELSWYKEKRSLEEKNNTYIETATALGIKVIEDCLQNKNFLISEIPLQEIDAIFYISSTGLATPGIEARIMNILPFSSSTKRIPIWGLGCAGGASGLSRAYEYCLAFPAAMVLVVTVELCSLTFQKDDHSKSNLIGTSLFADGAACALVCGDQVNHKEIRKKKTYPVILGTKSKLLKDSLDIMGWNIKNEGLFVVFSRDIPGIIENWLKPNVEQFLQEHQIKLSQTAFFIAHPGGKRVLEAYQKSMGLSPSVTDISYQVLRKFGNMSSVTVFFVLKRHMELEIDEGKYGFCTSLGPGFSSEFLLMRWMN